jgi:hypothetical protein
VTGLAQAAALWMALLVATASGLSPRTGRWGWWLASLVLLVWLAMAGWPGPALVLALGATVAQLVDRRQPAGMAGFTGLLRSVAAVLLGYAGASYILVRLVHAEFGLAQKAFPALAIGLIAGAVLALAEGDRERLRAARLLVVLAAIAWTVVGGTAQEPTAWIAAAWLPLLAGAGRRRLVPGS